MSKCVEMCPCVALCRFQQPAGLKAFFSEHLWSRMSLKLSEFGVDVPLEHPMTDEHFWYLRMIWANPKMASTMWLF